MTVGKNDNRKKCFFPLIVFGGSEDPIVYVYSPLPPPRGQPTAKCHPRWQPILGQQSTVGWADCWIQTQDCSFPVRKE
jgi:hypothetical protein